MKKQILAVRRLKYVSLMSPRAKTFQGRLPNISKEKEKIEGTVTSPGQ